MDLGYYQVDKGSPQPCCHTFFFCFFEEEEAKAEVGLSITQVQVTDVVKELRATGLEDVSSVVCGSWGQYQWE